MACRGAPARAGAGLIVEEVAEAPVAQEEAEVDLADDLAHGALDVGRVEAPVLLVDAGFVARQGHDLARFGEPGDDCAEASETVRPAQAPGRSGGPARLEERCLGDAEGGGGVAHPRGCALGAHAVGAQAGFAREEV